MTHIPHIVEAVLDLIPPNDLCAALKYQANLNDTTDDWEPRHVMAAQIMCEYAKQTHPGCRSASDKLLQRLEDLALI